MNRSQQRSPFFFELRRLSQSEYFDHVIVHTGQNYDYELNEIFFTDLGIRKPDHFLNAAGATGAETIGNVIIAVDILAQPIYTETSNVWGLFNQNINIMQGRLAAEELQYADVVIQPDLREKAHIFDVKGREATMKSGIDAANAKLSDIQFAIDEKIAEQNMSTEGLSAQSQ